MIETILFAAVFAWFKGYKLKPVLKTWAAYLIFFLIFIYILLEIPIFLGNYSIVKFSFVFEKLYFIIFFMIILKYRLYRVGFIGSLFVFAGTALNKIAIAANGGHMPVFPSLSLLTGYFKGNIFTKIDDIHILGSTATKLKFLTDFIDIGYSILSIGDIFIRCFIFLITFSVIRTVNETFGGVIKCQRHH